MPIGVRRLFSHRLFFVVPVLLGTLLALSTTCIGFFTDDYVFIARLEAATRRVSPWKLYEFASGDVRATYEDLRRGPFPWWSAPDLKIRFFRPLSAGLFSLDHALFGHDPLGYHMHAVLWYALLLISVGLLLRCALSPPVWGLTFLLYALSTSHAEPVAWLSSRHMLVAAAPSIAGLAAYIRYREHDWKPGRYLALAGLVVGLFAGEAALSAAVYAIAYEAFGTADLGDWRRRARRSAPIVAIVLIYLGLYKALGYGVAHSAAYFEPFESPSRFVTGMLTRVPLLLGEIFLNVPSGLAHVLFPVVGCTVGILATCVAALCLRSVWSLVPIETRRALKWLGGGAALSLLITVGGFPGSRLVLVPGIGGFAVIATIIAYGWERLSIFSRWGWIGLRASCVTLLAVHLFASPLGFVVNAVSLAKIGGQSAEIGDSIEAEIRQRRDRAGRIPMVFILSASDPIAGLYVGSFHEMRSPKTVGSWVILSMSRSTHTIRRVSDDTLTIQAEPSMLRGAFEGVFRSSDPPFRAGDQVALDDAVVTVLSTEAGRPATIQVRFTTAILDDPALFLLAWRGGRLDPIHLAPNEILEIPWSAGPTGFF